ncbi:MAG: hypothetical protein M0P95_17935 [Sulfuritalea sp.]|jgi:hypothetical protein|nr:hypothetical protein [Sulfuritalea sp.]
MKSNDLKKGDLVQLKNGWYALIADNMKGNIRMAEVFGNYTETGSVYVHDIRHKLTEQKDQPGHGVQCLMVMGSICGGRFKPGLYAVDPIELTDKQIKHAAAVGSL